MEPIEDRIDRLERLNEEARLAARDVRLALRGLRRAPGFALLAVLTLALGIGANAAIFTWVHAELLAALPYRQPDRLVALNETSTLNGGRMVSDTYPDFLDWRRDMRGVYDGMAWVQTLGFNLSGAGVPEEASGSDVSANYFDLLGVDPGFGRKFAADEHEAVVTAALARRHFGTPAAAVGRNLDLSGTAYTVVGVLPPVYRDPNQTDIFIPAERYMRDHPDESDRGSHGDNVVMARLKPGVSLEAALTAQRAEMARLAAAYPESNTGEGAAVRPLRALFVGNDAPMLWMLSGAVGLVLLIACANVAGLLLVRTASRRQEWAVRAALGASRVRLLRQMLAESLVTAALGGAAGLGLAVVALRGLRAMAASNPSTPPLRLDWPVVAFAAGLCTLAAVGFGLAPARQAGRLALASTTRVTASARGRNLLVAGEVALALMLAVAAGLMLTSFARLMAVNPGFRADHVLGFETNFAGPRYRTGAARLATMQATLTRLRALPGVTAAAVATNLPLSGNHSRGNVTIAGRPVPARGHFPHPDFHSVSPGYLQALGLPLLRGRDFNDGDTGASPPVALVSATFAKTYWPDEDPVGRQFWLGSQPGVDPHALVTVVGVVGDTRLYGLDAAARIEVYQPFTQDPPTSPDFVLRTAVPPLALAGEATAALRAADPGLPATNVQTMEQIVAASVANSRAMMWLLGVFGGLALLLAMLGIYGVVSHATQQRTRELGIRLALGARPAAIAGLVLGGALRWVGLGAVVGLAGAVALGRLLASQLYAVSPENAGVLFGATAVLLAAALAACWVPMRRATRVDPAVVLRCE